MTEEITPAKVRLSDQLGHADETQPLVERLMDEADLCRNDGATDIAALLDDAVEELKAARKDAERYRWLLKHAYIDFPIESPRQPGWTEAAMDSTVDAAMASMLAVGAA